MSGRSIHPNVYGIETEYSHIIEGRNGTISEVVGICHSADPSLDRETAPQATGADDVADAEWAQALRQIGLFVNENCMLSNGGRFYVDESGVEYATPETTTAADAVVRSLDGDKIVANVLHYLTEHNVLRSFQLNRRNVDHNQQSRGVHINTATTIDDDDEVERMRRLLPCLITLNVAKGALFGSGGLLLNGHGETEYHHSPRLSLTSAIDTAELAHTERPLVRRPFKNDYDGLKRIETITSDALNFPWPLRASLVITNALVGAVELGYGEEFPKIPHNKAVAAAHTVGKLGYAGRIPLWLSDGERSVGPLDILREYSELILDIEEQEEFLDSESRQVIPEIIDASDQMTIDLSLVARQVESVARLFTIRGKMQSRRASMDSEVICRVDYAWDKVYGGYAEQLRDKGYGWQGFPPTKQRKPKERLTPPSDTRAYVRGNFIQITQGTSDRSDWYVLDRNDAQAWLHPLDRRLPDNWEELVGN